MRILIHPGACLLCLAVVAGAQPNETAAPGGAAITGSVLDADTGSPIADVGVSIGTREATTAKDGGFRIQGVQPGTYNIKLTSEHFVQASESPFSVIVSKDRPVPPLALRMSGRGAVSGVIEDGSGSPVANATAELMELRVESGQPVLWGYSRARSGPDGRFAFDSVLRGRYFLYVSPTSIVLPGSKGGAATSVSFAPTFYPNAASLSGAATVTVNPGDKLSALRVVVGDDRKFNVSGKVDNLPAAGSAQIQFLPSAGERFGKPVIIFSLLSAVGGKANIMEDGSFRLAGITTGTYVATILANGVPVGGTTVEVTDRDVDLRISARPTFSLGGKVAVDESVPLAAVLTPGSKSGDLNDAVLELLGEATGGRPFFQRLDFDADGKFHLDAVPAGPYRIRVYPRGNYGVSSIRLGGKTYEGGWFQLDSRSSDVQVVISRGLPMIGGTAVPPDPFGNRAVTGVVSAVGVRRGPSVDWTAFSTTPIEASGAFRITSLEPGQYLVCAWTRYDRRIPFILADPSHQGELSRSCETIDMESGRPVPPVQLKQIAVEDF